MQSILRDGPSPQEAPYHVEVLVINLNCDINLCFLVIIATILYPIFVPAFLEFEIQSILGENAIVQYMRNEIRICLQSIEQIFSSTSDEQVTSTSSPFSSSARSGLLLSVCRTDCLRMLPFCSQITVNQCYVFKAISAVSEDLYVAKSRLAIYFVEQPSGSQSKPRCQRFLAMPLIWIVCLNLKTWSQMMFQYSAYSEAKILDHGKIAIVFSVVCTYSTFMAIIVFRERNIPLLNHQSSIQIIAFSNSDHCHPCQYHRRKSHCHLSIFRWIVTRQPCISRASMRTEDRVTSTNVMFNLWAVIMHVVSGSLPCDLIIKW